MALAIQIEQVEISVQQSVIVVLILESKLVRVVNLIEFS
jgi:hypothetical protein